MENHSSFLSCTEDKIQRGTNMAIGARLRSSSQIYHVMLRGAEKQDILIYLNRGVIMQILKGKKQDNAFFAYAHCVMVNHIHIVIREETGNISRILEGTAICNISNFNGKYLISGHVYKNRPGIFWPVKKAESA